MSHNIPQELIDEIIRQSSNDKQSLLAWSVVSRACNLSTIPHLFHTICARLDRAIPGPNDLRNFLADNPRIRPLVKQLKMVGGARAQISPAWALRSRSIVGIMQQAPNLEELDMQPVLALPMPGDSPREAPVHQLKRLRLDFSAASHFRAAYQIATLFAAVDTLILRDLHFFPSATDLADIAHPYGMRVKSAIFGRMPQPIVQISESILRLDKNTLRSLSFTFCGHGHEYITAHQLFRIYGETLHHLGIDFLQRPRSGTCPIAQGSLLWRTRVLAVYSLRVL